MLMPNNLGVMYASAWRRRMTRRRRSGAARRAGGCQCPMQLD
ncbi:MAG: hypothetical protein ACYYK0_01690 [Candidatus Eutrophobiaceae bacterium]